MLLDLALHVAVTIFPLIMLFTKEEDRCLLQVQATCRMLNDRKHCSSDKITHYCMTVPGVVTMIVVCSTRVLHDG